MSTPSTAPFAARVDDAIRQAQTVLALSPDGLDAATTAALNEQLRRFREEVVEPVREQQGCALPGLPLGLALTVSQGEVLAGIFEGAARGSTFILMPTPEQRATLARCPLWLAQYGEPPTPRSYPSGPDGWPSGWSLWQYTNGTAGPSDQRTYPRTVPGFRDPTQDRSVFRGTLDELRSWWKACGL